MTKTYIFGHKNPDTDTILSSIVYGEFLQSKGVDLEVVALGECNNETKFLLNKFGLTAPKIIDTLPAGSKIILVDHNEAPQSIDNLNDFEIVGVIDHHKFGNFSTKSPLYIRSEALCSTCSVIYNIFKAEGYQISKTTASLMISAILSDSLLYKSPTTTDFDKKIVEELNKIAGISNIEEFAMDMFNAKSDLGDISIEDLIKIDYKEFDFNGTKAGIGVIETVNPTYSMNRKQEILKGLEEIKAKNSLDIVFLSIVDILKEKNITFVLGDKEKQVIKDIYGVDTFDNMADLGNILSRKKQVVPQFTEYFNK